MRNELAATEASKDQAQTLDIQMQILNMQLIEQLRAAEFLRGSLANQEQTIARAEQRLADMHATIERKNEHIAHLESTIKQIEAGRVLKSAARHRGDRACGAWRRAARRCPPGYGDATAKLAADRRDTRAHADHRSLPNLDHGQRA